MFVVVYLLRILVLKTVSEFNPRDNGNELNYAD